ncbi:MULTISPECIES: NADH-quinone oxidoreductase subunit C [Streptomyces]|uniref:NADH-quinone oxidoreductase subunit C n=1 Tax=Streptomyces TaxID=1883 RepID=UPI0004CB5F97|nr:NADH-quinone oxidoreductase subunit C [Streptomyces sp. NRRL S-15]
MTASEIYDGLPDTVTDVFGPDATAAYAYDLLTVDVPAASWTAALETARDELGCTYFDWLSAVDEPGTGFRVCAHVVALGAGTVRRLLVRTTVPHDAAALPTAVGVYAGAAWHERETYEMFGIAFEDHPHLVPLLLPESFEGHPLRKDFVLAARVAKAWPGAKEPGESEHGGPKRRTMLPPGVPDPNEWGPLKGQLPPAPARPARGARAAGAAGDRPVRRARSASEGSAAQRPAAPPDAAGTPDEAQAPQAARPRRARSASQGSASQATGPAPAPQAGSPSAGGARGGGDATGAKGAAGSADAPWHDARPAFDEPPAPPSARPEPLEVPSAPEPEPPSEAVPEPEPEPEPPSEAVSEPEPEPEPEQSPSPEQGQQTEAAPAAEPGTPSDAPAQGDADRDPDSGSGRESESGPDSPSRTGRPADQDRSADQDRPADSDRPAGGDTA